MCNSSQPKLNPERVSKIFFDCLYDEDYDREKALKEAIIIEGIIGNFGFRPNKIDKNQKEIIELLLELPIIFMKSNGVGASFLNACIDRHGNLWTGEHMIMEQLFALGSAVERVICPLPKIAWVLLPGGMPYYQVIDD